MFLLIRPTKRKVAHTAANQVEALQHKLKLMLSQQVIEQKDQANWLPGPFVRRKDILDLLQKSV